MHHALLHRLDAPGPKKILACDGGGILGLISVEILARILPLYVRYGVYRAIIESAASEHGARRTAMKNATDNAGDIIKDLRRSYNRARQAQITQEIAELVGGAEALKG